MAKPDPSNVSLKFFELNPSCTYFQDEWGRIITLEKAKQEESLKEEENFNEARANASAGKPATRVQS